MADLVPIPDPLAPYLGEAEKFIRAAKAPNTVKAYRSDWRTFETFCRGRELSALPATPATVAAYAADAASHLKANTVERHLAAISQAHQLAGLPNPVEDKHRARGHIGGIESGTATDGSRIYAAISNNSHASYTLTPTGQTANGGSWTALDAATGAIIWQTADPAGAMDSGSVSEANGVMYAGSGSGGMYALDAQTGHILWSFASGGSVIDGPSISNGVLYWGSGYTRIGNNVLYAFSLSKH